MVDVDNKMKQTAVEWLEEQLIKNRELINLDFNQAKQMEISQESEVYLKGFEDGVNFQIKLDKFTFKSE